VVIVILIRAHCFRFELYFLIGDSRPGMTEMTMLTEFEESVSFDADDPDFAPPTTAVRNVLRARYFTDVKFDVGKGKHILMLLKLVSSSF